MVASAVFKLSVRLSTLLMNDATSRSPRTLALTWRVATNASPVLPRPSPITPTSRCNSVAEAAVSAARSRADNNDCSVRAKPRCVADASLPMAIQPARTEPAINTPANHINTFDWNIAAYCCPLRSRWAAMPRRSFT